MKKIISTKQAPAAIGPYNQAILVDNTLYASGQLGIDPATGEFVTGGATEQTEQVFRNIKAILDEAGMKLSDIVKTTVFLSSMENFGAMNEVYAKAFGETFPARSAFEVARLPKDGLVEIEFVAIKD